MGGKSTGGGGGGGGGVQGDWEVVAGDDLDMTFVLHELEFEPFLGGRGQLETVFL